MGIEKINTLKGLIAKANRVMGKKLTTKDIKKMNKSYFCGPNKSFPCNDCKHVAVAKAYLGKAKFSKEAKKRIASCINRRAKELGCVTAKKVKAGREHLIYIELSYEQKQLYTSEVFKTTKILVEDSLLNPDMEFNVIDITL